jgi:hypothetical protein
LAQVHRKERIARYCKDLLDSDESVLAVAISDEMGDGVAAEWKKDSARWVGKTFNRTEFENAIRNWGAWVNLIIGVSKQSSPLMGSLERVCAVYSGYNMLLTELPGVKMNLAVMALRSADIEHLYSKIMKVAGE